MGIWTMALPGGYLVTALVVALVAGVDARAGFALAGVTMITIAGATWTSLGRVPLPGQRGNARPAGVGRRPGRRQARRR
jgi:hypothetical protein